MGVQDTGRNVLLKRLRQDSDDQEVLCQRCEYLTKDRLVCSGCKLNFCLKCANVGTNAWQCITKVKWTTLYGPVGAVGQHSPH